MAEPITWRNVVAQENGASLDRMARAMNQVTAAFSNLARIPEQLAEQEKARATDAVSAALANARSVEEIDNIIRGSRGDWRIDQSDLANAGNARRAGLRADEVAGFQLAQARDAEAARALQGDIGAQLQQDIIDGKVKSLDQIPGFATASPGVKSILQSTYGPMIQRADEISDAAAFRELEHQDQLKQNAAQLALQRESLALQRTNANREQARWDRQDQQAQAQFMINTLGQMAGTINAVPGVDAAQSAALRGKDWDSLATFSTAEKGHGPELKKLYDNYSAQIRKKGISPLAPEQFAQIAKTSGWFNAGGFRNSATVDSAIAATPSDNADRNKVLAAINTAIKGYGSGQIEFKDLTTQFQSLVGSAKELEEKAVEARLKQEADDQRAAEERMRFIDEANRNNASKYYGSRGINY